MTTDVIPTTGRCTCDTTDARLCWRVREALARAGPNDSNPKCPCACHRKVTQ